MNTYLATLKAKGFKITPLRKVMLDIFLKKKLTMTPEELCVQARRKIPNAGLQSIYRNLAEFTKSGIAEEIFYRLFGLL